MLCSWRSEGAGSLPDGRQSRRYTLRNLTGATIKILDFGGIVQSISVPDSFGECQNVALGFSSLTQYLEQNRYFGAIIGRSAGRILGGEIVLQGHSHKVSVNSPPPQQARRLFRFRQEIVVFAWNQGCGFCRCAARIH